uniref:YkgJ family cysteine cluster protein n=1 Tax=Ignisphaera aggregans TaxID=334771 RepID=A0A7J3I7R2_9CREN
MLKVLYVSMDSVLTRALSFVDFGDICRGCTVNCCKRFYAVLLPEEEERFRGMAFTVSTPIGDVKAIGAKDGKPCPYLDSIGRCSIYPFRSFDCRLWPIILYYDFNTGEKVVYLDLECPAAAAGRIDESFIKRVVELLKGCRVDIEWLKRYTLAPWPNNLREIARFR